MPWCVRDQRRGPDRIDDLEIGVQRHLQRRFRRRSWREPDAGGQRRCGKHRPAVYTKRQKAHELLPSIARTTGKPAICARSPITVKCSLRVPRLLLRRVPAKQSAGGIPGLNVPSGSRRRCARGNDAQLSKAICLRLISSKSISAPMPGTCGQCARPSLPISMSLSEAVLVRAVRQQHLEVRRVANRAGEVQLRHVVERVAAVVHLVVHVEGLGEVRGLEHGGEPALHGNVAAQVVGRRAR